jgi:hypothetical protein
VKEVAFLEVREDFNGRESWRDHESQARNVVEEGGRSALSEQIGDLSAYRPLNRASALIQVPRHNPANPLSGLSDNYKHSYNLCYNNNN